MDKAKEWQIYYVTVVYTDHAGTLHKKNVDLKKYDALTWSEQGKRIIQLGAEALQARRKEIKLAEGMVTAAESGALAEVALNQELAVASEALTTEPVSDYRVGTQAITGPICLHDTGCTTTCW